MKLVLKIKFSFLVLVTLLLLFNCVNKENKSGTLKIDIKYCKYSNEHPWLKNIIILKNGENYKEMLWGKHNLIDLPYGNYEIQYKSIYNQKETININIDNDTVISTLCIDKINYALNKNILLLDELKTDETVLYDYKSNGCFDSSQSKLLITKKGNSKYTALYNNTEYNLSKKQYQLIREFEIELRSNHAAGCSTIDRYGIYNNEADELYITYDESGTWEGFPNLIKLLNIDNN